MRPAVLMLVLAISICAVSRPMVACSMAPLSDDEPVRNTRIVSPDGSHVAIVRVYAGLGDFDEVVRRDLPQQPERSLDQPVTVAVYAGESHARPELFRVPVAFEYRLTNDGAAIVIPPSGGPCGGNRLVPEDELQVVTSSGASSAKIGSLLSTNDALWLALGAAQFDVEPGAGTLRATLKRDGKERTFDIDVQSLERLGPIEDLLPPVASATAEVRLDSRSVEAGGAMPSYPSIAVRARISGVVIVEFDVDDTGRVVRTAVVKPLPFGLDAAATEAVAKWTFAGLTPGAGVRRGEAQFRFRLLAGD